MNTYVYGDKICELTNIQFFPREYYDNYISKYNIANNIVYMHQVNKNKFIDLKNPIIITKVEYLDSIYDIINNLKTPFILITHYGGHNAGNHRIKEHPLLIKWYGQNMSVISHKTEAIPLGLENPHWKRTDIDFINKNKNNDKTELLYINLSTNTHNSRPGTINALKKKFTINKKVDWYTYIKELSRHKFCISPRGSGVDCHRTWECLYLGVIPIVEKSVQMNYFQDLPILFVDNYNNIDVEFLNKMYDFFTNKSFNLDKLNINYWKTKIDDEFNNQNII
tara:strand:+ start:1998 stop:2837 length:840 start_codon:yes stop_codon:yes gene_type:complete